MNILLNDDISNAIEECSPTNIAVAYIGADWKKYIRVPNALGLVIISPTLGSNPYAITDLVNEIGWEKVEFIDELHAKLYIGNEFAIIGSANLTRNGLSGNGLVELCYKVSGNSEITELKTFFDALHVSALKKYPSIELKKKRLSKLYDTWSSAISSDLISNDKSGNDFANFEVLANDHFYISWFQPLDCKYSDEAKLLEGFIENDIHFTPFDNIKPNKWVLMWQITQQNRPHKIVKPSWLYIHEVVENGVIDKGYEYPTLALQRNDKPVPQVPFELTRDVIKAFNLAVCNKETSPYLIQSKSEIFDTNYAQKGIYTLVDGMKKIIGNKNS